MSENQEHWELNYFNYFTEIEEHFQQARGTGLFLLSPLDWALIEGWKNAGIPLEAVLRGIDAAFAKWRSRPSKFRRINSLAYCTQAVMEEAQAMAGAVPSRAAAPASPPFTLEELRGHLSRAAEQLRGREEEYYREIAASLEKILAEIEKHSENLEALEQRLSALEDRMASLARIHQDEEALLRMRRELDNQLRPYRGKMTAAQLAMLEKQYLDRRLLEDAGLPRLSLFYLK